jgi:hypothetical protein
MTTAKSIEARHPQAEPTPRSALKNRNGGAMPKIDQPRADQSRSRAEAQRRAAFVRGMGGSVCGYSDGYMDGFEYAIEWLLGEATTDLFALTYRPDAGMDFSKRYYASRPKERKRILELFEEKKFCGAKTAAK